MEQSFNVIGDVAGRYDELMALLKKMPEADKIILVGDLPDRGPNTQEVIQWCIDNQDKVEVIRGNHEMLMIYGCENGDCDIWFANGGLATLNSYGGDLHLVPKEHVKFLKSRPLYFENDEIFVSHAPVSNFNWTPKNRFTQDYNEIEGFVWNRSRPYKPYGNKFMIYGHNGRLNTSTYLDGNGKLSQIAQCIDNSHANQLCGIHWPTKKIFSQTYFHP